MRWIDSWPLDKTWNQVETIQRDWIDSTAGLWVSSESWSWRRAAPESLVLEGFAIYFLQHLYGPTAVTTGQIQCRAIISRDFRRFSRTRFTRWIFCNFHRRRPLLENSSQSASDREKFNAKLTQTSKLHDSWWRKSRADKPKRNRIFLHLCSSYEARFFANRQPVSFPSFAVYIPWRFELL